MGAAKININVDKDLKCKTILGTPHYMAPELISQKNYNHHVDLWSFGVCLYEMICGVVPFAEGVEDPYEIYHTILGREQIHFPPIFTKLTFQSSKKLIEILLNNDPKKRIPHNGFKGLKQHEFFHGFDFEDFESKEMIPPCKDWIGIKGEEDLIKARRALVKGVKSVFNKANDLKQEQENVREKIKGKFVKNFRMFRNRLYLKLVKKRRRRMVRMMMRSRQRQKKTKMKNRSKKGKCLDFQ